MFRFLFIVLMTAFFATAGFAAEPVRLALLIGNQAYNPKVGRPLKNPLNDVRLIEAALKKVGFTVTVLKDADLKTMTVGLQSYTRKLGAAGPNAVGFFYYSGHGVANPKSGDNYLIPVDIADAEDERIWDEALRQTVLLDLLKSQAKNATHFVIFDACRTVNARPKGSQRACAKGSQLR